jgi:heat shock protein HslJ
MRALVLIAALAACAPPPETDIPEGNWLLPGTTWRLVELDGAPFAADATATLTEDGRIVGQAPCNTFHADYVGRWPNLGFEAAASTRRACPDLALEAAFFAALDRIDHAELLTDSLLLTGHGGASLRFVRA